MTILYANLLTISKTKSTRTKPCRFLQQNQLGAGLPILRYRSEPRTGSSPDQPTTSRQAGPVNEKDKRTRNGKANCPPTICTALNCGKPVRLEPGARCCEEHFRFIQKKAIKPVKAKWPPRTCNIPNYGKPVRSAKGTRRCEERYGREFSAKQEFFAKQRLENAEKRRKQRTELGKWRYSACDNDRFESKTVCWDHLLKLRNYASQQSSQRDHQETPGPTWREKTTIADSESQWQADQFKTLDRKDSTTPQTIAKVARLMPVVIIDDDEDETMTTDSTQGNENILETR
ncbi:hypothetical protein B0H66DRAFT_538729 [Apodospora peruviana]|uniref:Uncharacterized protein n=1 Tax=Apodospora peruviana TaxID=516989 RepID=A0AAE0LYJ9_9PEZI|nr:hypothetical protein B0H66DRAFT_538729 [Apodospora peruviana]